MPQNWDEKSVFLKALELDGQARSDFLESACPSPEARRRIESLLAHREAAPGQFLAVPPGSGGRAGGAAADAGGESRTGEAPEQLGEFRILRELGRGGMGVVYLARDTVLDRLVALKVLGSHLAGSSAAIERFRHEARAVAALNHPSIVPIFRAAEERGIAYLAMEYVEGETLDRRIRAANPAATDDSTPTAELPRPFASLDEVRSGATLMAAVADAIDHAHRQGVIHRDIKPSNIIVDQAGAPHLTDFGIAKLVDEEGLTLTGDLAGTVHYMSPEQAASRSAQVDHRTDIFSLGVVLYELLTLRRPFEGSTSLAVIEAIRSREPPPLRSVNPMVPRDLAVICHKALEKLPQNRYQTAAHMAADLRCFLAGDPILARPPSLWRRARAWSRRHRRALSVASVAALVLSSAALAAGGWRSWRLARSELAILSSPPGASLLLARFAEDGGGPGPARPVGAGSASVLVLPGHYRVTALGAEGGFGERDVLVVEGGGRRVVEVRVPSPAEVAAMGASMVAVPAGECECGHQGRQGIQAPRRERVAAFLLDRREVSNADYLRYMEATGAPPPPHWPGGTCPAELLDRPVTMISWEEAGAFADWAGKRLPSAVEWECAMRAPDGRLLPWGEETPPALQLAPAAARERANVPSWTEGWELYVRWTRPVGSDPELATPLGFLHAETNVAEYTADVQQSSTTAVVVKGGSWATVPGPHDLSVTSSRPLVTVDTGATFVPARSFLVGFRCARSGSPAAQARQ